MDNARIIDLVLAAVLLLFAVLGAHKGLIRSLMALVSVVLSLVCAALLTAMLTQPVTDLVYPLVEQRALAQLGETSPAVTPPAEEAAPAEEGPFADGLDALLGDVLETLKRFGVSEDAIDNVLHSVGQSAVSAAERAAYLLVKAVVQAALFLLLFVLVLILLKLITHALDAVCRLPVLHALNTAGGAMLSLTEGVLIIFLIVYLAPRFGVTWFSDHAEGTYLLAWFMSNSPYSILVSLT